jgi:flagellar protein FlaF
MNSADQARRAYGSASVSLRAPREAEHEVIARITARMKIASRNHTDFLSIAEAVHENRVLWTRLSSDVADGGNGLPQDLRARLFYLAQFTDHHSRKILKGEAEIGPLIDINTAVMRGLMAQRPVASTSVPANVEKAAS